MTMMTGFHFSAHDLAFAAAWLAAGAGLGTVHFLSLRWNLRMLAAGRALLAVAAVQLTRFVTVGILLAAITIYFGALPLLAATLGLLAARTVIVRREATP